MCIICECIQTRQPNEGNRYRNLLELKYLSFSYMEQTMVSSSAKANASHISYPSRLKQPKIYNVNALDFIVSIFKLLTRFSSLRKEKSVSDFLCSIQKCTADGFSISECYCPVLYTHICEAEILCDFVPPYIEKQYSVCAMFPMSFTSHLQCTQTMPSTYCRPNYSANISELGTQTTFGAGNQRSRSEKKEYDIRLYLTVPQPSPNVVKLSKEND